MRHAIRRLFRAPAFALTVLTTLALGIGATAAVFSIVDAVLLRPLPYAESDRLVALSHTLAVSGVTHVDQSDASYLYYRDANRTLSGAAAYATTAVNLGALRTAGLDQDASPARVAAARVSANIFAVLRVAPLQGRIFRDGEDRPDAAPVVLIGERLWRQAYGARPDTIGRHVPIDGVAREIVGIMPARFRFPAAEIEIWLPIGIDRAKTDSASFDYRAVGRLRDGVSATEAQADLQQLLLRLPDAFPGRLTRPAITITGMRAVVSPLRDVIVGDVGRVLWVVLGAVGCILLVGCANVANLFLVRREARQTEMAVRRALGAGPAAMVGEQVSEAVVLAAAGSALGFALGTASVKLLQSFEAGMHLPRLEEAGLDGTVIGFAAAVSMLVALLVSGVPGLRASATDRGSLLTDGGRAATAGRARHQVRRALVVIQIALALVLVTAAGLMARSFAHLTAVEPGFDPGPVYTFRVALPAAPYATHADAVRLGLRALDDISALPGVQVAGAATKLPLADAGRLDTAIFIEDRPLPPGGFPNVHQVAYVSPGYFRALSISLVEGRTFKRLEAGRARPEVIVSQNVARRYWGNEQAVGRHVRIAPNGEWLTVVGVAAGVRGTTLEGPHDEMMYLPLASSDPRWTPRDFAVVVRTAGAPTTVAPAIAHALRRLAPDVPLYGTRPMTEIVTRARARTSFLLLLFATASGLAMALAAVGLFGVSSYVVSLRRSEMAIRLALGARPQQVQRMIVRQGITVAAVGVLVGLIGALATTRALEALLFGVNAIDPATLVVSAAVMIAVAAAANWLPARRAASVDPAQALRTE
jgi:predicted permease